MSPKWQRDSAIRDLFAVATVTEARHRWQRHETTIKRAIWQGKLDVRMSGHVYLITVDSLIRLWGRPAIGPDLNSAEFVLPDHRRVG